MLEGLSSFAAELRGVDCKPRVAQMKIDGLVYTSTKLAASDGLELWPRLMALVGPGVARAVAVGDTGDFDLAIMFAIAEKAASDGLLPTVRDLLRRMQCNQLYSTKKEGDVLSDFDEHFSGEYAHLLKVLAFSIAHNLRGPTLGFR